MQQRGSKPATEEFSCIFLLELTQETNGPPAGKRSGCGAERGKSVCSDGAQLSALRLVSFEHKQVVFAYNDPSCPHLIVPNAKCRRVLGCNFSAVSDAPLAAEAAMRRRHIHNALACNSAAPPADAPQRAALLGGRSSRT